MSELHLKESIFNKRIMAKPRVFVSSTYYDLKHIRASLDIFVDSLGYEPVLSEKGDIAYTHDRALDESCYREAENSDIFVLIIGGRYGSEASGTDKRSTATFFERYESITKKEYETAVARDIPVYILIEKGVYSEYQTFLRNKEKVDINYAHVESINVFYLIENILLRPRNNPLQTFEKFDEIESWLRDQWSGLFRELLRRQSQQQQLAGLTAQVTELKETNGTLKKYLEAMMIGSGPQKISKLIESEEKRLEEVRRIDRLKVNRLVKYLVDFHNVDFPDAVAAIQKAVDARSFAEMVTKGETLTRAYQAVFKLLRENPNAKSDFNEARIILDLLPIDFLDETDGSEKSTGDDHVMIHANSSKIEVVHDGVSDSSIGKLVTTSKPSVKAEPAKKKVAAKKTISKKLL